MVITLTYLLPVLRLDHFFLWFEEFSLKLVYLDFSVKIFLLGKLFQHFFQLLVLRTDLLKRNNFSVNTYLFMAFLTEAFILEICMTENEACNRFPCSALFLLGKCFLNMLYILLFKRFEYSATNITKSEFSEFWFLQKYYCHQANISKICFLWSKVAGQRTE